MKNALAPLKRFIQNKNTVTIICIVVGILTLVIGYNYRVNKAIDLVTIPYALKEIPRKTQITKDMIGHVKVPRSLVTNAKTLFRIADIVKEIEKQDGEIMEIKTSAYINDKGEMILE